jgi:hypothetical protein
LASEFDAIAMALHLESSNAPARTAVMAWLNTHDGWLLIFDDVTESSLVHGFLPVEGYRRHVILTSRSRLRVGKAVIELKDWSPDESREFLKKAVGGSTQVLEDLGEQLCHVPLALDQASSYMRDTTTSPEEYLRLIRARTGDVLELGRAFSRSESVATTYRLSMDRAEEQFNGASQLLHLCSLFSDSGIPRQLPRILAYNVSNALGDPPLGCADFFEMS